MITSFSKHIKEQFPFLENAKLLVACSGGVDSVVLAHLLAKTKHNLALAHCNFSLRGKESDEDELFVENVAQQLKIPFFSETFQTKIYAKEHKISTQMAARELRYTWFSQVLVSQKFDYILTGHHADDDLETFFINLSRGTGLRGLTGIPEKNETIVRPLLIYSRAQIISYAKKEQLFWREDSSNTKTEYLRNKIRLDVVPQFKEISDRTLPNFQKTQQHLRASQQLIEDYMALIYNLVVTEVPEGYSLDIAKISELPNTKALLYELLHPFGFTAWDDLYTLLFAQTGKEIKSATHRLLRNRNELLLTEIIENNDASIFFIEKDEKIIENPIFLRFIPTKKIGNIENTTVYVDKDTLTYPLIVRKWSEGDVFQPFGMQGKKKLSKFFKDEKLSLVAKQKVWLLCSEEKIVWVVNHRLDDRFKVTSKTKNLLTITTQQ